MINEDSAFGPGMMFGIPGPGPKKDRKPIPSDPKKEKGIEIKKYKMKNLKTFEEFIFKADPEDYDDYGWYPENTKTNK